MPRLLIIDDNREVCEVLEAYLSDRGHDVITLCNGAAARHALETEAFDGLIVDAVLPGVSGLDLAQDARERGIPVIVMSGYPQTIAELSAGPEPFLKKPFRLAELEEALRYALTANHSQRTLAART